MSSRPQQVLFITGASSGIGLATALAAARAGWLTVATVRSSSGEERLAAAAEAAGVSVDIRTLDVTDAPATADCLDAVNSDHGRLDIVVNNAGAGHVGTLENEELKAIRACLEVNFFGVLHVAKAALPHLRHTHGKLMTISSVGGAIGQPFNEAYCAAKFAVEGFLQSLRPVARSTGVQIGIVEPAAVTSSFVQNAGLDVPSLLAAAGPYRDALQGYLRRVTGAYEGQESAAQTPEEVAEVILATLAASPMPYRTQTSPAARKIVGLSLADLDGSTVDAETSSWLETPPSGDPTADAEA